MLKKISVYNLANLLTLLRILMVPCFVMFLAYHSHSWALGTFILAAVTDYFDGWAARKFNLQTVLGTFLDPVADKMLVISAYIMLTLEGRVEFWMTVLVITRDLMVVIGFVVLALLSGVKEVKASWWGKAATFLQMGMLSMAMILDWPELGPGHIKAMTWGLGFTVILTFLSGLDYVVRGILKFEEKKQAAQAGMKPPAERKGKAPRGAV